MQKHTYEVHLLSHANPEDKADLLWVWENNLYEKEQAEHRWAWFAENPILVQHYLLKVDGATEGSVTVVPKTFSIGAGLFQVGGLLTDMSVNEKHRNMKAAMVLLKQSTEEALGLGCNFLFGTPSTNSYPIFKRKFNKLADYKKYVKILNYQPILKQRMGAEPLATILAPVVNKTIATVDLLRAWYVGYNPNRDSLSAAETYRSGIFDFYTEDRAWTNIADTNTFIGDRSGNRLRWRYWGVYQYTSWTC